MVTRWLPQLQSSHMASIKGRKQVGSQGCWEPLSLHTTLVLSVWKNPSQKPFRVNTLLPFHWPEQGLVSRKAGKVGSFITLYHGRPTREKVTGIVTIPEKLLPNGTPYKKIL